MINNEKMQLSTSQLVTCLISGILGTEVLYAPRYMVEFAAQDGWIYTALGSIYPLYMVFLACVICKHFPNDNIISVNTKLFGKVFGTVLNTVFLCQFIFNTIIRAAQLSSVVKIYLVYYLDFRAIVLAIILAAAYACYNGFGTVKRMNESLFYFTFPILFITLGALKFSDFSNIRPVLGSGISNMPANIYSSTFSYYGIEILFLLYPYLKDKRKLMAAGLTGTAVCCIVFTWMVFITTIYLGIDIIPKYLWPTFTTVKASNLRAIRNFTFIFLTFWILVVLKSISTHYYASADILNSIIKKISIKNFCIYLIPVLYYLAMKLSNEILNRTIMGKVVPIYIMLNLFFLTLTAIFTQIKKGKQ